jgi:hypothetical protein
MLVLSHPIPRCNGQLILRFRTEHTRERGHWLDLRASSFRIVEREAIQILRGKPR